MLFHRDFRLTAPDGHIIESAVATRAAELTGKVQTSTVWVADGFGQIVTHTIGADEAVKGARAEAENEQIDRLRNLDHEADERAAQFDAETLAMAYRYDVHALMVQRDGYFFGNSTSRPIQLPRYERALKIAQDRRARKRSA